MSVRQRYHRELIVGWQAEHGAFTRDGIDAARTEMAAADSEMERLAADLPTARRSAEALDAIWQRLTDNALIDRDDLAESLEQMRQGLGREIDPESLSGKQART